MIVGPFIISPVWPCLVPCSCVVNSAFALLTLLALKMESRLVEVLTLASRWLREQRDKGEAQQAEAQSD